jgi:acyl-CoA synthetase (AMP-forming)/AMP-acid ligase II
MGNRAATLIDVVRRWAQEKPDSLAFTFLADGESAEETLSFEELDRAARALAVRLQSSSMTGERALLVYPTGREYVVAFLGCLYGGVIPVPTYPPRRSQGLARLQGIAADCRPRIALATARLSEELGPRVLGIPHLESLEWIFAEVPGARCRVAADEWREPSLNETSLAFLQYTSGSTAEPKGVKVTHGNLMHNEEMIASALETRGDTTGVSWLPVYHDMGLIGNVLHALYVGGHCVLMSPHSFLQKPVRWLRAITRYGATTSGGPNFAYELCATKITPEQRSELDLSRWSLAFTGAEPIQPETLKRFARTFEPCGFRHEAFYPCYGMAETTLFVTGGARHEAPVVRTFDAGALERHLAVETDAGASGGHAITGCGRPWMSQRVVIVDPEGCRALPDRSIGEIWVSGASVAQGYWGRDRESEEAFEGRLSGSGDGPFLRTGDLGFLDKGELFVTGRLKDLIIIRGTNHYPQDIELTVERCHDALRPAGGAAFSVAVDGVERLVIVSEVDRIRQRSDDLREVFGAVRAALSEHHQLKPWAIALIKPGAIPKTSSGKIQRGRCRDQFQSGSLPVLAEWREPLMVATGAPEPASLTK